MDKNAGTLKGKGGGAGSYLLSSLYPDIRVKDPDRYVYLNPDIRYQDNFTNIYDYFFLIYILSHTR